MSKVFVMRAIWLLGVFLALIPSAVWAGDKVQAQHVYVITSVSQNKVLTNEDKKDNNVLIRLTARDEQSLGQLWIVQAVDESKSVYLLKNYQSGKALDMADNGTAVHSCSGTSCRKMQISSSVLWSMTTEPICCRVLPILPNMQYWVVIIIRLHWEVIHRQSRLN